MVKIFFWFVLLTTVIALIAGIKNPDNTTVLYITTIGSQFSLLLWYGAYKC
jgi:hypothetical protein